MKVVKFSEYSKVNEEFIGSLIKGALGKLFGLFSDAFKDLGADFKSMFKEDDPSSIKDIIIKNVDQAVDASQKEINNLKSDGDILGIMDNMVVKLTELANGMAKDVEGALGKEKAKPVESLAKAILLGSKEADFVGIVGALDPAAGILKKDINFKYSKKNYVTEVNKGKDIAAKKALATKFFDSLQKEIKNEVEKSLTDEEIKTMYSKLAGGATGGEEYKVGDSVIYLLKDKKKEEYDPKKKPEEQTDIVGVKKIEKIDGDKYFFKTTDGKDFFKTKLEIMGKSEAAPAGENAKKVADSLGKIKADEEKMGKVATFADFIQDEANKDKLAEIEKIITGGQAPAAQA
jgi:hypothetical protein